MWLFDPRFYIQLVTFRDSIANDFHRVLSYGREARMNQINSASWESRVCAGHWIAIWHQTELLQYRALRVLNPYYLFVTHSLRTG